MIRKDQFPLTVEPAGEGQRCDVYLRSRFPDVSRARWEKLLTLGVLKIGSRTLGPATRLHDGQVITCDEIPVEAIDHSKVDFSGVAEPRVVFEDASLCVIDKPVDLIVHAGSGIADSQTLVAWLQKTGRVNASPEGEASTDETWDDEVIELKRPGIVHRLDKGTSGLMVVAKHPQAAAFLSHQFAAKTAKRRYQARVHGTLSMLRQRRPRNVEELLLKQPAPVALKIDEPRFSIVTFFERDPRVRTRFRVSPTGEGRRAVTHGRQVASIGDEALINLELETGRTHQIRIHLSFLGLPIVGDEVYGKRDSGRMWLHARELEFVHPESKQHMNFTAPWPEADALALKELGFGTA